MVYFFLLFIISICASKNSGVMHIIVSVSQANKTRVREKEREREREKKNIILNLKLPTIMLSAVAGYHLLFPFAPRQNFMTRLP